MKYNQHQYTFVILVPIITSVCLNEKSKGKDLLNDRLDRLSIL